MSAARTRLVVCCLLPGIALVGLTRERPDLRGRSADTADPRIAVAPPPRPAPEEHPLPAGAIIRFGTTRFEACGCVIDLTFAADGAWLIGCGEFAEARIWDARTGGLVRRFGGDDLAQCVRVGITPDNRTLSVVAWAWSSESTSVPQYPRVTIRRYDVMTGREVARIPLPDLKSGQIHAAFSPDGTAVYAGCENTPLFKYDLATGRPLWNYQPNPTTLLRGVVVSPDGRVVALTTHGPDAGLRLLDTKTGTMRFAVPGREGGPGIPAFSPDSQSIAVGTTVPGKGVAVWSLYPLAVRRLFDINSSVFHAPLFSPDGKTVALWGRSTKNLDERNVPPVNSIHLFDPETGSSRLPRPEGFSPQWDRWESRIPPVVFSPDGKTVVVGGERVALYDTASGQTSAPPSWENGQEADRYPSFTKDDLQVRVIEFDRGEIVTRDAISGQVISRAPKTDNYLTKLYGSDRDFTIRSADGRVAVNRLTESSPKQHVIHVRDATTGREIARVPTSDPREQAVALSPNGKQLCTADWSTLRVYDVFTKKMLENLGPGPSRSPKWKGLELLCHDSMDGRYLAVITEQFTERSWSGTILDTATWQSVRHFRTEPAAHFRWTDGSRFVIQTLKPQDRSPIANREVIHQIADWEVVYGCLSSRQVSLAWRLHPTISPNGRMMAAWGEQDKDGSYPLRIYETESGRERHRFVCYEPGVELNFLPRDRYLLSRHPGIPHVLWDLRGDRTEPQERPDAAGLARAWADLTSDDAVAAFRAVRLLAQFPDLSLPLLRAKLPPVAPPDPVVVGRLVADLDADDFLKRERAGKELERLGRLVIPALQKAATHSESPEVARRAHELVHRIGNQPPGNAQPVVTRALEVVEWADAPDAAKLLAHWAGGAAGARLTEEAKTALARLAVK
ncbi:WD40 repeat domain-containing protein [Fimbriiglobus ruber]|uniref:High-affnity carbon uptake protein Hat/HatR n=1 Tax=Fimbriiglobus ruber TaxID=1908690 RepID=A0A225DKZ4_9BACT|nr:WD40 repeat domain-containing protein [Fimbriiglobus ruber]OWK37839.1 High-affnity carbon uptake protein Hat/HatR [Fimbriiglobus ruber]